MAISPRKLAANQKNAQWSTGPRTPEGKARVRHNALKHGLLAKEVIVPVGDEQEKRAEFDLFLDDLWQHYAPVGPIEAMLVDRIAVAYWRLRRATRAEVGELRLEFDKAAGSGAVVLFSGIVERLQKQFEEADPNFDLATWLRTDDNAATLGWDVKSALAARGESGRKIIATGERERTLRPMAMGKRKSEQAPLWIPTTELPVSPGHPFYVRLNTILDAAGFDRFVEEQCRAFYAPVMGRPSLAPGRYFRLLLIGYFEGLDSERGIAWRAADSLAVRTFLGLGLEDGAPDHSTISRTRRLIDVETHRAVFTWVQERLVEAGLLKGQTIAIDATTLEANAAMRSIVRRDTGESYQRFLTRLAAASGIKTPTRAALARLDRRRKKRTSNAEWVNPSDPDAKVAKMKDGRTHLAHKAEHAVDLETGALVAVTLHGADVGDTTSLLATALAAGEQLEAAQATVPRDLVGDKGYHSNETLLALAAIGVRAYLAEPDRGRRCWMKAPEAQGPVYGNRRRVSGRRGKRLMRRRGEYVERTFAHLYDTGGLRRTYLRGHQNILKRLIVHAGAFNLGLLMRHAIGRGTPRGLQGGGRPCFVLWLTVYTQLAQLGTTLASCAGGPRSLSRDGTSFFAHAITC